MALANGAESEQGMTDGGEEPNILDGDMHARAHAQPGRTDSFSRSQQVEVVNRRLDKLATKHECVTLFFCDIVGFTTMSKEVEPEAVMRFLNDLYTQYDQGSLPAALELVFNQGCLMDIPCKSRSRMLLFDCMHASITGRRALVSTPSRQI
jgi:hypothetical protein